MNFHPVGDHYTKVLFILFMGSSHLSCERIDSRARAGQPRLALLGGYSSDRLEFDDIKSFYKNVFGSSDDGYWMNWDKLDDFSEGSVILERVPYLDSWYPEKNSGTNVNGSIDKYDNAFYKGVSTAANWELTYNNRQTPSWYGHCNGTSVASSRFQNPLTSVTRPVGCEEDENINCVIFSPSDIRALLSEINMNAKAKFISGNRCRLTKTELEANGDMRANPLEMDACDDVNPGSFHVGLINFLGRNKQPLIFDMNRDEEVWNYPIYEYKYTAEGPLNEEQALEKLDLDLDNYIYNPAAESWYFVTMTVSYRKAVSGFDGAGTKPPPSQITYTYLLELDDQKEILGGEWVGESRSNHPDFLWMAFEPSEPSGSASRGNPYIDNDEVISIWAESVGLDPKDPFRDKPANAYDIRFFPSSEKDWGLVEGYYRLVLDGRTSGAVFLGKPTYLRILVGDALKEESEVDIFLNGKSLGRMKAKSGKIDLTFDSPPGINYLNLKWDSRKVSSSEIDWEFRYVAM